MFIVFSLSLTTPYFYFISIIVIINIIIISKDLLAQCEGCLGWVWQAGLLDGLRVGQVFGVLLLPGFGVGSSSPQVPPCATRALNERLRKLQYN